jgi:hypothetical protein
MEDPLQINEIIKSNKDKAFNRLYNLQLLLKKESALKELCKIVFKIFFLYKWILKREMRLKIK